MHDEHGRTNLHCRPHVAHKTFRGEVQTAYQRTAPVPFQERRTVPVLFQKRRTVPAYLTSQQKLRRTVPYCHPCLWCANTYLRLRDCDLLGTNCKIIFESLVWKKGLDWSWIWIWIRSRVIHEFEFDFCKVNEFEFSFLKVNEFEFSFFKVNKFEFRFFKVNQFEFKNYKKINWSNPVIASLRLPAWLLHD